MINPCRRYGIRYPARAYLRHARGFSLLFTNSWSL